MGPYILQECEGFLADGYILETILDLVQQATQSQQVS